jgi:hypothetical protein
MDNEEIIKSKISFWIKKNPKYREYFSISKVQALIHTCEIIAQKYSIDDRYISDFIDGLALSRNYLITKNEEQGEEVDRLMKPLRDLIIEHVTSEEYRKFLIDREISGEAIVQINDVKVPISQKEILLHIGRSKSKPLTPNDIAVIERDWHAYKQKQYNSTIVEQTLSRKIESKPKFKPEEIQSIYNLLKDFFSEEHQVQFLKILKTGNNATEKLIFSSNGNRLADAFKQLINSDIITGCNKIDLESWIGRNFCYIHRKEVKKYTSKYLNDIISTNKEKCQKPVLNTKLDKAVGRYVITKA